MEKRTPEQIVALEEAIKKQKALSEARMARAKTAVNAAKEDENVRIILTYLMELCGFRENPVVTNINKEVTNATTYNVGRTSVFHDFRKLMSAETENLIERREE